MFSTILSGAIYGIDCHLVCVEVDLSQGLPCFVMVGNLGSEVKEARQKSGTWITVDMALEQGKNVYAVPGRLTDRLSDGCNLLIRQGAGIALTPEDLLAELQVLENRKEIGFEKEEKNEVLEFLDFEPKSVDQLLEEMHQAKKAVQLPTLLSELIRLCMEGKVRQIAGSFARIM